MSASVVFFPGLSQKARVPSPVRADQSIRGEIAFHADTYCGGVCVCLWRCSRRPTPSFAQSGARSTSSRATGENYHVEFSGLLWDPTPSIFINSESIDGIVGSRHRLRRRPRASRSPGSSSCKVVLRPATKHKFRFEYTPIKYRGVETVLSRDLIFNGIEFPSPMPIEASSSGARTASRMSTTSSTSIAGSWGSCSKRSTPTSRRH